MSATLQSGQNAPVNAANPLLSDLLIGFGWDVVPSNSPMPELVPSAIICDEDGRAVDADAMVFFNQLTAASGAVQYVTDGDQEQIDVDLAAIPAAVHEIVFVVYVDPDLRKPGTFDSVRGAYVRVADREGHDILRFDLPRNSDGVNAMIFGELYRYKGQWKFRALGDGFTTGIAGVLNAFGMAL
ncbi:TerD family protein [Agromyces humi]|uniref:TerD family protein n=1 Tax=Agromyces humi TaxID=1766800 RepID=UPI00135C44BF|nr:TerD family protein [Agromyces humi]